MSSGSYLSFPFRIGHDGRTTAPPDLAAHIRDELLQLVLTTIGERLFQPAIGTNVRRLVFENVDEVTAGMTKSTVAQAVSRWLGHRIEVDELAVTTEQSTLTVDIHYRIAGTEDSRVLRFQRSGD